MSFKCSEAVRRLLLTAAAGALTGCATVAGGGWHAQQQTTLVSDPPAAAVVADGEAVGETPVTVPLRKRGNWWGQGRPRVVLRFEKEGFAASEFQVESRLDRWIFGNLVLAALSGAMAAVDRTAFGDAHPGLVAAGTLIWSVGIDVFSGAAFTLPRTVDTKLVPRPGASRRRPLNAPGPARFFFHRSEAPAWPGASFPRGRDVMPELFDVTAPAVPAAAPEHAPAGKPSAKR